MSRPSSEAGSLGVDSDEQSEAPSIAVSYPGLGAQLSPKLWAPAKPLRPPHTQLCPQQPNGLFNLISRCLLVISGRYWTSSRGLCAPNDPAAAQVPGLLML